MWEPEKNLPTPKFPKSTKMCQRFAPHCGVLNMLPLLYYPQQRLA